MERKEREIMKTKIILISFILIACGLTSLAARFGTGFIFRTSENTGESKVNYTPPTPAPNNGDKFLFGGIHCVADNPNYNEYDQLGLNLWHTYVGTELNSTLNRFVPVGPIQYAGY